MYFLAKISDLVQCVKEHTYDLKRFYQKKIAKRKKKQEKNIHLSKKTFFTRVFVTAISLQIWIWQLQNFIHQSWKENLFLTRIRSWDMYFKHRQNTGAVWLHSDHHGISHVAFMIFNTQSIPMAIFDRVIFQRPWKSCGIGRLTYYFEISNRRSFEAVWSQLILAFRSLSFRCILN